MISENFQKNRIGILLGKMDSYSDLISFFFENWMSYILCEIEKKTDQVLGKSEV